MRICLVSEYFWPDIGGIERSTERLGIFLTGKGHDVHVVTQAMDGSPSTEVRHGLKIHRWLSDHIGTFCHRAEQAGIFQNKDFICLFGVGHDPMARHWEPIVSQQTAVKGIKIGTQDDIRRSLIPIPLFRKFDAVFCQNEAIVDEAVELGIEQDSCFRIKNGLDIEAWQATLPAREEARESLRLRPESYVVSCVGRFVTRKRFPLIVQAFSRVYGSSTAATLLLHGSDFGQHDGEESYLRQQISSLTNVRIVSPQIDSALTFAASDVFITLGEREGAPNVIIEALASRCAVIVNDISGHHVYIRNNVEGIVIADDSVETIGEALKRLEDRDLREIMAANAWRRASEFDISVAAATYLDAVSVIRLRRNPNSTT